MYTSTNRKCHSVHAHAISRAAATGYKSKHRLCQLCIEYVHASAMGLFTKVMHMLNDVMTKFGHRGRTTSSFALPYPYCA